MRVRIAVMAMLTIGTLAACDDKRANDRPRFSSDLGLPTNCRALIQQNIDGYRSRTYTAEAVMASIERNCGAAGHLW